MLRRSLSLLTVALAIALSACDKKTPIAPTPPAAQPVKNILLEANLAFGSVTLGDSTTRTLKIRNTGDTTMTVTSVGPSVALALVLKASWTSGTIGANSFQDVTLTFTPAAAGTYTGVVVVSADNTSGTNTIASSGTGVSPPAPPVPSGPKTSFGTGQYRVNTDIVAGRYFTKPSASGCYWERQSGFGGTLGEILANDFVGFAANQLIVDIRGSDLGFKSESQCGTWNMTPRSAPASGITPGTWLVGSQINAGGYRVNAGSGCYWERLRDFSGNLSAIIANDFVSAAGQVIIAISPNDTGFHADGSCGVWSVSGTAPGDGALAPYDGPQSRGEIEANRNAARARWPNRQP